MICAMPVPPRLILTQLRTTRYGHAIHTRTNNEDHASSAGVGRRPRMPPPRGAPPGGHWRIEHYFVSLFSSIANGMSHDHCALVRSTRHLATTTTTTITDSGPPLVVHNMLLFFHLPL